MSGRAPKIVMKGMAPWSPSKWVVVPSSGCVGTKHPHGSPTESNKGVSYLQGLKDDASPPYVPHVKTEPHLSPRSTAKCVVQACGLLGKMVQVRHHHQIGRTQASNGWCWRIPWHGYLLPTIVEAHGSQRTPYKCQYDPLEGLDPYRETKPHNEDPPAILYKI